MKYIKSTKFILRALRVPFLITSILPFLYGSLLFIGKKNFLNFTLGLITVMLTHLSANLMNDYSDSKTGLDWQDNSFYKFFGGSKLIQEEVFSEKFYLIASLVCSFIALLSVITLSVLLDNFLILGFYIFILLLSWAYSKSPIKFSYRRLGEIIIFLLFGPIPVMIGYFLQSGIFISFKSFLLSLPFGFLALSVLLCNEIPDYNEDLKEGKLTLVNLINRKRSFVLYGISVLLVYLSIIVNIFLEYSSLYTAISFVFLFLPFNIVKILQQYYKDKERLMESSKLGILFHIIISLILISDVFIK